MLEITDLRDAEKSLQDPELQLINAWWRAANYLSVGQIYLLDNPLLREPLAIRHIKPRLSWHSYSPSYVSPQGSRASLPKPSVNTAPMIVPPIA